MPSTFAGASVTFRSTVMCGNRLNDWNTMPMCRRTRFWSMPGPVIRLPHSQTVPPLIGSSRLMHRSSVDLPDPDAPIRHTTSCEATARSMPLSTSFVAERFVQPLDPDRLAAGCRAGAGHRWVGGHGRAARPGAHRAAPASRRRRSRSISRSVNRASGMVRMRNKMAATVKLEKLNTCSL